ncbi:TetR/AcrR family transcriptional regulator [Solirubrobacter ginsenosidimutans]|uniref:TetR/AcrR family transcriptional regulator n=1 Tax=Solirubrobacter ginsenosidimutans TaxID=490573 RepID=A0A9X3S5D5_9ACTN|nr:TetR/AcrR family transcriptional regulator [Solirubrobacter ginsenosidimutans]MDA0165512.1 TetR/AcrR family transcriptional regulator [Solirubrobacter ginsenosidimutans]
MAKTFTTPQGQVTRDRILEVAIGVFAGRGFRSVSIDAIAAEAGVSRQGLLYHFPSKTELLVAALDQHEQDNAETVVKLFEDNDRVLVATMRAYVRASAPNRGLIRMLLVLAAEAMDAEHPAHDHFVERYRALRGDLTRLIAAEQAAGRVIDALPPHRLAAVVIAVLDGLQLQEYLDEGSIELEETYADLIALFLNPAETPPAA